jgi:hypothetical protein
MSTAGNDSVSEITAQLAEREPLFHRPEFGTTRHEFWPPIHSTSPLGSAAEPAFGVEHVRAGRLTTRHHCGSWAIAQRAAHFAAASLSYGLKRVREKI